MKIIYGRAGTGKSEYILNHIKNNKADKVYIITPEQFSFTAEKRLLEILNQGATTRVEVLPFARMANRVISETIPEDKTFISKSGKSMIIYNALNKNQKELKFLGKTKENIDLILTQITEFKKHNISIEKLKEQIENTEDQYLKSKLNDMLIMYKSLNDKIEASMINFIDENDSLTLLAENIEKSHLFDDAVFYIDEFAGFTKQEYEVIQKLNAVAKEVYITICTDELRCYKSPEVDIFYDNKQTVQTLSNICEFDVDKQIKLEKNYRFKNEELIHLEKNIYSSKPQKYDKDIKNIELYLAENPYNEVEYVAAQILNLVRNHNYKYDDIAVICNNIEAYSSLCKVIFEEYDIPVFIDYEKDITQNVLIKYFLSIFDIFAKSWSYESVFNYLKTNIVNIDSIYELEKYCLKWGIQGKKWYADEWNYEDNNFLEEQKAIVTPLRELQESFEKKKTVKEISSRIYSFIKEQIQNCDDQNNVFSDIENVEAWNVITDILDELVKIFGDETISFDDYSKLVKAGLSGKELGQIPATQDKVIVGDVNRSKTNKVKAMFVIGVNDGIFPSNNNTEGFFDDRDRVKLKEDGFELAKGTLEKLYEENFNIYKAFSTAEEKLFVSYSSSNSDGASMRKSLIITKLQRIFPKLIEKSGEKDEILTPKVTFSKLINNIDNPDWVEVYEWYKKHETQKLQAAMKGIDYTNISEKINQKNLNKLYGDSLKTSVSKLETYVSCPFSYFLKYGLKIAEKEKFEIKLVDTGSFMHNVIDEFFKKVDNVKEIDEEEMKKIIDEIVDENIAGGSKFALSTKNKILVQRLKRVIYISMKYIIESLKNSSFDVLGTEISFGKQNSKDSISYPPIEMRLEDGKKVLIEGKIDRVDIAKMPDGKYIRIIDYKSSTKDIDLNKVIAGLQLQLITYVDAMCETDDFKPAGALYYSLIEPKIASTNRNMTKEEINEILKQNFRMNGLVLANIDVARAMDNNLETGKSSTIPVTLDKNGDIDFNKSSAVTKEEFEKLQQYSKKLLKKISKEILSGNIDIKPYYLEKEKKTPCSYCEYKSICQFDQKNKDNNYKYIPNKKRKEILDSLS